MNDSLKNRKKTSTHLNYYALVIESVSPQITYLDNIEQSRKRRNTLKAKHIHYIILIL